MDKERLTPYKVTLFNQRLDGVRQSFDAMAEFENKALCYKSTERISVIGDLINKEDLRRYRSCVETADSAMAILNNDIKRNVMFWPKNSRYRLASYLVKASEVNTCGSIGPMINSSHMTSELKDTYTKHCLGGFDKQWNELTNLRDKLQGDAAALIDSEEFR